MFVIASPKGAKQSRGLEEIATAPAAPRNDKHPRLTRRIPPRDNSLLAFPRSRAPPRARSARVGVPAFPFAPMLVTLAKVIPEHVEGVDAGVVSVGPDEAEGVGADPAHAHGADGRRNVLRCRRLRMISKLSPAPGAGAVKAKRHPGVGGLVAVGPLDREGLVSDAAELYRSRHLRTQQANLRYGIGDWGLGIRINQLIFSNPQSLIVVPTHVVYTRRGRFALKRRVGPMEIVVVQPLRERMNTFLVRLIEPGIGPFGKQGLDEPLRLAIGLRAIGSRDLVPDLQGGDHLPEGARGDVAPAAIRHDSLDPDALLSEEGHRSDQEASDRRAAPIGQDLHEGEARGIIHGDMDDLIASAPVFGLGAHPCRRCPPPAGTRPKGFMSMWMSSPGCSRTYRI